MRAKVFMDWWKTIEIHLPSSMMIGTRLIACWLTIKKINQRTSFRLWVLRLYSIACRLYIIYKNKNFIFIFGSWVVVCLGPFKQFQKLRQVDQVDQDFWQLKGSRRAQLNAAQTGKPGKPGFIAFFNHLLFKFNSYKFL